MEIYHIDADRFERIKSQGYQLNVSQEAMAKYPDGDSEYHLIRGERALCDHCGRKVNSLKAETPADLEMEKRTTH